MNKKIMDVKLCIVIVCACAVNGTEAATEEKMRELLFAKLNNTDYSPRVRPIKDTGNVLRVTIDMYLVGLNGVDEVEQKITSTAYLKITWSDTFMTWNETEFDNIRSFTVPQNAIWKPDLALANAYDSISGLGDSFMYVVITSDGIITWQPFQVFESSCSLDMTYFPFDSQVCDIQLVTWSSTKEMINVIAGSDGFNTDGYETNANWDLLEVSTVDSSTSTTAGLSFRINMKRKPIYFLINFIIPIFLLSILNTFAFVLPCDSGEKSGYAMILFLSFAIFLLIVTEIMPEGMNTIPVMSTYLITECVFSTIIVFLTIFQLRLHNQGDDTPVPGFLESFTNAINALKGKVCCANADGDNNDDAGESIDDPDIVIPHIKEKIALADMTNGSVRNKAKVTHNGDAAFVPATKPGRFSTAVRKLVSTLNPNKRGATRGSDNTDSTNVSSIEEGGKPSNALAKRRTSADRLKEILNRNKISPERLFTKPPASTMYNNKDLAIEDVGDDLLDAKPQPNAGYVSRATTPSRELSTPVTQSSEDSDGKDGVTWPDVVLAMDTLFFVIFLLINVLAIIVAFGVTSTN